jgi:RimJ/RimL family protein N-acetyltransferase
MPGQREVADQAAGVQAELGWVIHPDQQGHGYAREAVEATIRMCFEDLGLRRLTAGCFSANEASWRMAEKLGMRRETATVRDSLHRAGTWMEPARWLSGLMEPTWDERAGNRCGRPREI